MPIDWAARAAARKEKARLQRWANRLVSNSPPYAERYGPIMPEPWRSAVAEALRRYRETGIRLGFPRPTQPDPT